MNLKDLINKELQTFSDEQEGYKVYPRARFAFTKERAEEFSRVTVEQLIDEPYFLGLRWNGNQGLYPALKDVLLQLEEERKKRIINQFVFTGAIGGGKSTLVSVITFIEVFRLLILPDPSFYYGLTPNSDICFIMLSRDENKSKKVTFKKIFPLFANSPAINDYFPSQIELSKINENPRTYPSELRFPKHILIFPGSSSAAAALGFNAAGGVIDEANDFEVIEKSKKAVIKAVYDGAAETANEILNRMDSRFPWEHLHRQGKRHGILCLIGQTRGPDSFLERKIREAEMLGSQSTIFWIKKALWESQPRERFSREEFIFDTTQGKIVDFIKPEEKDLSEIQCEVCGVYLKHGAYLANNSKLTCSLDCYEETFFGKSNVEKEKASGFENF